MRNLLPLICAGLLLAQLVSGIFAYDDGDWQYWNTESIEGNISKKMEDKA